MKDKTSTSPPTLAQLGDVFVRYANFTFGGGNATIAVMHRELLEKRGWIDNDTFTLCFALARLTPGTNVLAFFTGVGWRMRGLPGAIIALLAATIPCTLILVAATALFSSWQDNPWVRSAISGAIAGAIAITLRTAWTIAEPQVKTGPRLRVAALLVAAFVLYVVFHIPAIDILIGAAIIGALFPTAAAE